MKNGKKGYPAPPKIVQVTPQMATKWLEGNTHNRRLRQTRVDQYARDMRNGQWLVTHQGVAFTPDGVLVDGQHRLWAVIESGCTVPMLVFHGLPVESQLVIDDHLGRNIIDSVVLTNGDERLTTLLAAVMRRAIKGLDGVWPRMTKPEIMALWEKWSTWILAVWAYFPASKARCTTSAVLAPLVRAHRSPALRDDVKEFCEILYSGQTHRKRDKVVVTLRDQLLTGIPPEEQYRKTETALDCFIRGKTPHRITLCTKELFPVPEDKGVRQTKRARRKLRGYGPDLVLERLAAEGKALTAGEMRAGQKRVSKNALTTAINRLHREGFIKPEQEILQGRVTRWALVSKR